MNRYIEIVEYGGNGDVVSRIDVTGKPSTVIDKIDSGININLDHENYYTRENLTKETLELKPS